MRTIHVLSALVAASVLFTACSKTGDTGPSGSTGPAGPSLTGNIKGFVSLYDQYGAHIATHVDSSLVAIDGTTTQSYADSAGRYTLSGLHTGIYSLSCSHAGYGASKVQNIQFTGGGDLYRDIHLSAIPAFSVDSLSIVTGPGGLAVTGHLASDAQPRTILLFVGAAANTSADPATYLTFYNKNVAQNQNNFVVQIPNNDLLALGLTTGQTVYFAAYGATPNYNNSSSYLDLNTDRTVFTAISATAALKNALVP